MCFEGDIDKRRLFQIIHLNIYILLKDPSNSPNAFSLDSIRGCARFDELSALEKRLCVALMIMPEDFIRIRGMVASKVALEEKRVNEKAREAAKNYAAAAATSSSSSSSSSSSAAAAPVLPPAAAALATGQELKAENLKVDVVRTGRKLSLRVDVAFATAKPSAMATLPGPLVTAAARARARAAAEMAGDEAEKRKAAELRPVAASPAVAAAAAAAAAAGGGGGGGSGALS